MQRTEPSLLIRMPPSSESVSIATHGALTPCRDSTLPRLNDARSIRHTRTYVNKVKKTFLTGGGHSSSCRVWRGDSESAREPVDRASCDSIDGQMSLFLIQDT